MTVTKINLKDIRFHSFHGVMEQERMVGNDFVVNLSLELPLDKAMRSDRLEDTVNYAEIYAVVKQEMDIPSALLEHAAARVLSALKERFPSITAAHIELEKLNPPFGADIRSASVEISERYQS